MTSKERADLKAQAMKLDSIFQIGKSSITPQQIEAIKAALKSRELIKINVLKNCLDDPNELAQIISERTGSQIVQVIGKKIILYKKNLAREEKKKKAEKMAAERKKAAKSKQAKENKNAKKSWTKADSIKRKKANDRKKTKASGWKEFDE